MKKLIVFLFALAFIIACNESNNKVKVIENYDINYLSADGYEQGPGTEEKLDSAFADIKKVTVEEAKTHKLPVIANIAFRIYINKSGRVEGIKPLKPSRQNDENRKYTSIGNNELLNKFAAVAAGWEFTPATLKGEPVNCYQDAEALIRVETDGSVKVELPSLNSITPAFDFFNDKSVYFIAVEEQPQPIGGLAGIQERIVYPEIAKRAGIEGRVFVKAYIDENGNVVQVELLKGIGAGCDESAMKAVKETKFIPGKQRGKAVKVQVSVPIVFKLN